MDSEKKERLKQSLEVSFIRTMMIIFSLALLAGAGFCWFTNREVAGAVQIVIGVFGLFWVAIMAFYGIWLVRIFRNTEEYVFCKTKLVKLHGGKVRNSMYFTVILEIPGEGKIVEKTNAIFQTHGWPGPLVEDYVNRTAEIAYNLTTEQVVVIG